MALGSTAPPAQLAAGQAVLRLMNRLPPEWRKALMTLRLSSAPYVICAFCEWRLDDPRAPAATRRLLLAWRAEARVALKRLKASTGVSARRRGAPPTGGLSDATLKEALSLYTQRVATAAPKTRDDIWRGINKTIDYSNWKTLRRLTLAQTPMRPL